MTTPHQGPPDGAITIGGSSFNYGQLINEKMAREQFEVEPPSNLAEALDLLPVVLDSIPVSAMKPWQKFLGKSDEERENGVVKQALIDSLEKHPFRKLMNNLFNGFKGTSDTDDKTPEDVLDAADSLRISVDDANSGLVDVITSGSNLIKNSDFERGLSSQPAQGVFSNDAAYSGTRCLKMTSDGAGKKYYLVSEGLTPKSVPSSPNDWFYVEVMVRGAVSNVQSSGGFEGIRLCVTPLSASGAALTDQYRALNATTSAVPNSGWTKLSGYVQMPANTAKAQFSLQLTTAVANGSIFYFDAVIVREVTLAKTAKDTADAANGTAAGAQTSATNAVSTANGAQSAAAGAQSTAAGAQTAATNAQTAANDAAASVVETISAGSNIIKNYDFERGNPYSGGTFVTNPVFSGSRSLQLVSLGSGGFRSYPLHTDGLTPKTVNAKEGDIFYLEVMVYGDTSNLQTAGGTAGVRMVMAPYARNNSALTEQYIYLNASTVLSGVWTKLSGYVTMPAGSVKAYLWLQLSTAVTAGEKYYFDNAICREVTVAKAAETTAQDAQDLGGDIIASGSNVIKNCDFERGTSLQPTQGVFSNEIAAFSGNTTLKMVSDGVGKDYALMTQGVTPRTIPANAGDIFYVEAMVWGAATNTQTSGGASGVRLNFAPTTRTGAALTNQYVALDAGPALKGTWTKLSGYITMPANTHRAKISLQLSNAVLAGNIYYWDNIIVREVTVAKTAQDGVDGTINAVNQAVDGDGAALPAGPATVKSKLRLAFANLFDGLGNTSGSTDKLPSDVKTRALLLKQKADATELSLGAANTNHSTLVDNIASSWLGDTLVGTTLSQALLAMQNSRRDIEENTKAIQRIRSKKNAAASKGAMYSVDFGKFSSVTAAGFTVTYTGSTANQIVINNGVAQWSVGSTASTDAKLIYTQGTATDFQSIRGTMAAPPQVPSGTTPYFYALARVSDDGLNYVWARAYCSTFGNYKADIGCTVGGVEQSAWLTGIDLTWSLDMRFTAGVGTEARQYQIWSGDKVLRTYTESGTTSRLCNLGHATPSQHEGSGCTPYRKWGAIAQVRNNRVAGKVSGCFASDNGTPSVKGSTARMVRTSTANTTFTGGNSVTALPGSFFDSVPFESQDIDANTATGTMKVSISKPYNIVGRVALSGAVTSVCTLILQRSTDNGASWSSVQYGDDVFASNKEAMRGNWLQYLNAGDMVRLAYNRGGVTSNELTGDSSGAKTFFAITGFDLDNDE